MVESESLMEVKLAKCESNRQKMTVAIWCQKYSVTMQPKFNALLENRWTKRYAASNSRGIGIGFLATATGTRGVGVDFLGLVRHGRKQATEIFTNSH